MYEAPRRGRLTTTYLSSRCPWPSASKYYNLLTNVLTYRADALDLQFLCLHAVEAPGSGWGWDWGLGFGVWGLGLS
eukprot:scaffold59643_cov21-Phaeocystis_antarctica.AAC.1